MYQIYQVGRNETIEMIARKLGIDPNELRRLNGIGENANIIGGSYIIIPGNDNSNMIDSNYSTYVIKQGDNMYTIAKENGVDLDTLLSINGLNKDDYIYPNQEIIIPNKRTYVTKENDTINDIVTRLNIDLDKIGNLYVIRDQIITY